MSLEYLAYRVYRISGRGCVESGGNYYEVLFDWNALILKQVCVKIILHLEFIKSEYAFIMELVT